MRVDRPYLLCGSVAVIAVADTPSTAGICLPINRRARSWPRSTDEELVMHGFACRTSLPQTSRWRVLLAMTAVAALSVLATAAPVRADVVSDWNATAAGALASPGTAVPPGAGQGAIGAVNLAMVHVAVYDAVNSIAGGHEPYASSPVAEPWYSQEAAVA